MFTRRHTTLLAAGLVVLTLAACGKDSDALSDESATPRVNASTVQNATPTVEKPSTVQKPSTAEKPSTVEKPAPAETGIAAQTRADVERVWNEVQDALRAGDGERLCGHTTAAYARRLVKTGGAPTCAAVARDASRIFNKKVPAGATPRYSSFSTSGDRASIRATLASDDGPLVTVVRMRLVRGAWEVDGDSGLDGE